MNAQDLKNSILQLAIQGKLVEQREEEGTAKELLEKIDIQKNQLAKEGKIKKQKALPEIKEDEIPFDIPESWEWVRIGEIGEIVGGGTPKTGNSEFWNGGNIPWLTPADMKFVPGKYVENGERFITEKGLKGSSARLMPRGTIIYSSRAPIGYIAIANNDLATNQGFKSLVPYELRINEYMYYCLISRTNEIISRASGTTFKEISGSEFGLTVVPLPPLEEQKRIVAKIEELMPYVEKYNAAYSEVEVLNKKFPEDMQKSILQYAIQGKLVEQREEDGTAEDLYKQIQDEKKKLIKEGKIKKTKEPPEITEDEIPYDIPENWKWVRFGDVMINRDSERIPLSVSHREKLEKIYDYYGASGVIDKVDKFIFDEKLMLIGEDGANLLTRSKPIAFLAEGKYWVNNHAHVIDCGDYIHLEFVMYYINAISLAKYVTGTAQPKMNQANLNTIPVPLPPILEQKRIVEKIEEIIPYVEQLKKKKD
ncbi:restriction endonuclease subunit S [Proteiniclasticum ruminis]|uniref:Type I restriction enzyme, S subunit n=1 Tax=Proteiniclasticum ruminis TaxID=398199 RepID=A0A1G8LQI7_9CLOT|nr:restriction endonuclease subunit S [Proteiniclasticum ruminis]SDI57944.1 type I restriction enzyme, S subunit [Proteiniclasticum ruminis]